MRGYSGSILTLIMILTLSIAAAASEPIGNLGYNSYEGYYSQGRGLNRYFGPGVGYPSGYGSSVGSPYGAGADFFHRYIPPEKWGSMGYGTGHLGEGWGPYIFPKNEGPPPPGLFDPLPGAYRDAPPPAIKVKDGRILVAMPGDIPGITCVTVTILAYNGAELATQSLNCPPYKFDLPVMDGVKTVRVRIDYQDQGLSATAYPL
ncbi:MAG: hypothetical protein ACOX3G_04840 [Armatimonadota bacterium]